MPQNKALLAAARLGGGAPLQKKQRRCWGTMKEPCTPQTNTSSRTTKQEGLAGTLHAHTGKEKSTAIRSAHGLAGTAINIPMRGEPHGYCIWAPDIGTPSCGPPVHC